MKLIIILILIISIILSIKLVGSIKTIDFCYVPDDQDLECFGKHNLKCGDHLCAKDRYSCQSLKLFSSVKNTQKNEKAYQFFKNNFEAFLNSIKECPLPAKYEWNSNDVCLKAKNCFQTSFWKIWSSLMNHDECECRENHKFRCDRDYCASDKRACHELKNKGDLTFWKC